MKQIFTLIFILIMGVSVVAEVPGKVRKQQGDRLNSRYAQSGISKAQVYAYSKTIVLKHTQAFATPVKVVVFNSLGQVVYNGYWKNQEEKLYLNSLDRGMYVVQLQQGQNRITRKVMLQ